MTKKLDNVENETQTLFDLDLERNTKNPEKKLEIHTVRSGM
jgi:hypothetical protein